MRRAILLFLKYPEPGKVKTRLAATIGDGAAVAAYEWLVATMCSQLIGTDADLVVTYAPADKERQVEGWVRRVAPGLKFTLKPQAEGDLGNRLRSAFEQAFADGYEQVAAIGSDCVEIAPELFQQTWENLATSEVVIGPANDGGYYLIGLSDSRPELFAGIQWSTGTVLAETLAVADRAGLRVYRLPELNDVDTEDDWRRAQSRFKR